MLLNTPICDFGWKAPEFTLKDADGTSFTMSDHIGENGLLIAFICNHCPYVQAIADRLAEDTKQLKAEGFGVLAVMSNNYRYVPADAPRFMKKFAKEFGFEFPYLVDETQEIGRAYDAVCTPDFFGFNNKGELQYRGRLDDAGFNDPTNRTPELHNAMRQVAKTGRGPEHQIPSMGCSIKWK
ncbi:thioredoxin family protein [Pseudovibrio brasiliensis]|uniref:Thioredoxin family protein n=1 Tax=Pseudovibrio brasiliensis TaxID=1898042 RepID=A0ABX8AT55_9HYPH|nr:thioredoxin family protein [Pseudovibrio brasiliensis]QUS58263.1 thioredoxin family protein [Pseudovibrio brasiliensis]